MVYRLLMLRMGWAVCLLSLPNSAVLAKTDASIALEPIRAEQTQDETALLNRYYDAQRAGDHQEVEAALMALLTLQPEHPVALRALGYHYQNVGKPLAAAETFYRAVGDPPDTDMLLSAGYSYQAAKRPAEASLMFAQATRHAQTPDTYTKACRSYLFSAPLMRRQLPEPWGLSAYSDTVYLSHLDNTVAENRLRLHRFLDDQRQISLYGALGYQDDTRSRVENNVADIYNDNYVSVSFGADWQPRPFIRLYAEVGHYQDRLNIPERARKSNDVRGGISTFHAWGTPSNCRLGGAWSLASYGQAYGSLEYVGRYDNMLGQATLWQGVRLYEHGMSSLSAYSKVNVLWDSEGEFFNNLVEVGPGLSWRPSLAWPVEFRLERLFARYIRNVPGDNDGYATTRLQMIINFDL